MTYDAEQKLAPFIPTPASVHVPVASPSNKFMWYVWWVHNSSGEVVLSYYAEDYNWSPTLTTPLWTKNYVRIAY